MSGGISAAVSLEAGTRLPDLVVPVTRKMIIMGATASRDWQPQHHDKDAAQRAGLTDIIMNNYTQAGLISRYITDWSGPIGRIGRLKFRMRRPICPDHAVHFEGTVVDSVASDGQLIWVHVDVRLSVDAGVVTTASVKLAMPATAASRSPWRCPPGDWRP